MGWETAAILLTLIMTDIDCLYRKAVEWAGTQRLVRIAPFKGSPLLSCGGKHQEIYSHLLMHFHAQSVLLDSDN